MRLLSIYLVLFLCYGLKSSEIRPPEEKNVKFHVLIKSTEGAKSIEVDLGTLREISQRNFEAVVLIRKRENGWELVQESQGELSSESAPSSSVGSGSSAGFNSDSTSDTQAQEQHQNPGDGRGYKPEQAQIQNERWEAVQSQRQGQFQSEDTAGYGVGSSQSHSRSPQDFSRGSDIYSEIQKNLYVGFVNPENGQCTCPTKVQEGCAASF